MNYILEYFDKDKQKKVTISIVADTDKKAINKVNQILKNKKFDDPWLGLQTDFLGGGLSAIQI